MEIAPHRSAGTPPMPRKKNNKKQPETPATPVSTRPRNGQAAYRVERQAPFVRCVSSRIFAYSIGSGGGVFLCLFGVHNAVGRALVNVPPPSTCPRIPARSGELSPGTSEERVSGGALALFSCTCRPASYRRRRPTGEAATSRARRCYCDWGIRLRQVTRVTFDCGGEPGPWALVGPHPSRTGGWTGKWSFVSKPVRCGPLAQFSVHVQREREEPRVVTMEHLMRYCARTPLGPVRILRLWYHEGGGGTTFSCVHFGLAGGPPALG